MPKGVAKIKQNILQLAKEDPKTKESYQALLIRYWQKFDGVVRLDDVISKGTAPLSITRAFQKLVELKEIDVPKHIKRGRQIQQMSFFEAYQPVRKSVRANSSFIRK